jgi:ribosomal protein S18 acetylase RimI-like enzyme
VEWGDDLVNPARFTTKELSKRTWPDFERLFSQGNGWDFCMCTPAHFGGHHLTKHLRTRAEKAAFNHKLKHDLVVRGQAHGILVYADGEPVGWCQFGPKGELPIEEPSDSGRLFKPGEERVWRVTCFCTHPDFSQQGVAGIALRAALAAIQKRGGGLVLGYPIAHVHGDPKTDERQVQIREWQAEYRRLMRKHGKDLSILRARKLAEHDDELRRHLSRKVLQTRSGVDRLGGGREVTVRGVGPVNAVYWGRYNGGTVAMFEREGFEAVSVRPFGNPRTVPAPHPATLVMQRTV